MLPRNTGAGTGRSFRTSLADKVYVLAGFMSIIGLISMWFIYITAKDAVLLRNRSRLLFAALGTFAISHVAAYKVSTATETGLNVAELLLHYVLVLSVLYISCFITIIPGN